MKKHLLCGAMALTLPTLVHAVQDKSIESLVVTATRTPVSVDKSLSSVTLLTREDIARSQSESLAELLGSVAGVQTTVSGTRGALSNLNVRGSSSDHVLILVDGARVASATSGAAALSQIPLSQIEKIELVRGPRSSLYGADALGGVLQIFTRKGSDELTPYAEVQVGSHDNTKYSAGVSGKVDNTKFSVSASRETQDGFDTSVYAAGSPNNDDDAYEESSFSMSVEQAIGDSWVVEARALHVESELELDSGNRNDKSENVNQTVSVSARGALTEDLNLNVSVTESKDESQTFTSSPSVFDTERSSATLQLDYQIADNHLATVGYDYYDDTVESTQTFVQSERYNRAIFGQYQYSNNGWSLAASVREDDNESYGKKETGSLSVGYQITDDILVSLSHGTAFKAPTFNDLFFPVSDFNFIPGTIFRFGGNADLKPEKSKTTELLVRGVHENLDWSFSYYETRIEDLIENDRVSSPGLIVSGPFNVSEALLRGGELTVGKSFGEWNTRVAMSYVDPRNLETDDVLSDRSRGAIDVTVDRAWGDFSWAVQWHAQSERFNYDGVARANRKLGGFNTVAMKASYQISELFSMALKVNNLFDKEYQTRHQFRTDGRNATLSFRYGF